MTAEQAARVWRDRRSTAEQAAEAARVLAANGWTRCMLRVISVHDIPPEVTR